MANGTDLTLVMSYTRRSEAELRELLAKDSTLMHAGWITRTVIRDAIRELLDLREAMRELPHAQGCPARVCIRCGEDVRSNRHTDDEDALQRAQTYHTFAPKWDCDCIKSKLLDTGKREGE